MKSPHGVVVIPTCTKPTNHDFPSDVLCFGEIWSLCRAGRRLRVNAINCKYRMPRCLYVSDGVATPLVDHGGSAGLGSSLSRDLQIGSGPYFIHHAICHTVFRIVEQSQLAG